MIKTKEEWATYWQSGMSETSSVLKFVELIQNDARGSKAFDLAITQILLERTNQERKWGEQNHDPFMWLTVLMEEVGELSQCALHLKFGGPEAENLRKEAVQVAAVVVAFIESIDRKKWKW